MVGMILCPTGGRRTTAVYKSVYECVPRVVRVRQPAHPIIIHTFSHLSLADSGHSGPSSACIREEREPRARSNTLACVVAL